MMYMKSVSGATTTIGYAHSIETSPGDHCLEVAYPGGTASPFWKTDGWKYSAPVRPEWTEGACNRTNWTSVDDVEKDYDGWTKEKNAPYDSVVFTKYGHGGDELLGQGISEEACRWWDECYSMTSGNVCYEQKYIDGDFMSEGFHYGACPAKFNTVVQKEDVEICNGKSSENIKYCPASTINITVYKLGIGA